ncbi:hypothetical protein AB1N83_008968 [Pleurotus pulmonarius]
MHPPLIAIMTPRIFANVSMIPIETFQQLLAPYLLGLAMSAPLYAVSLCQAIFYFRVYCGDPRYLKYTVSILIFVDSIRFAFLFHTVYMSFMTLSDALHLVNRPMTCQEDHIREITLMTVELLGSFMSCMVKSAYVMRIWRLSNRNKLLAGVIMFPALCELGSALVIVAGLIFEATGQGLGLCEFGGPFQTEDGSAILQALYQIPRYVQLSASLASDALITLSMVYYLKGGLKTRFSGTKSTISWLISYTLAIGLVTSILSVVSLTLFASRTKEPNFPLIHFIIANVYINSFLASLNWRMGLRKAGRDSDFLSMQGSFELASRKEEFTT